MQRLPCDELLGNLSLECGAVGPVSRHGFHPPEAQQRGSIQIAHSVHRQGCTPEQRPIFSNLSAWFRLLFVVFEAGTSACPAEGSRRRQAVRGEDFRRRTATTRARAAAPGAPSRRHPGCQPIGPVPGRISRRRPSYTPPGHGVPDRLTGAETRGRAQELLRPWRPAHPAPGLNLKSYGFTSLAGLSTIFLLAVGSPEAYPQHTPFRVATSWTMPLESRRSCIWGRLRPHRGKMETFLPASGSGSQEGKDGKPWSAYREVRRTRWAGLPPAAVV